MRTLLMTLMTACCLSGMLAGSAHAEGLLTDPPSSITVVTTPALGVQLGEVRGGAYADGEFQLTPYGQNGSATVGAYSLEQVLPKGHRIEFLDSSTCTGATLLTGVMPAGGTPCTVRFRWHVPSIALASPSYSWGAKNNTIIVSLTGAATPTARINVELTAVKPFVFGPSFTISFATSDLKLAAVQRLRMVRFMNGGLPPGVTVSVKGNLLLSATRARALGMTVFGSAPVVIGAAAAKPTTMRTQYAITLNLRGRQAVALALRKRVRLPIAIKLWAQDPALRTWHVGQMGVTLVP